MSADNIARLWFAHCCSLQPFVQRRDTPARPHARDRHGDGLARAHQDDQPAAPCDGRIEQVALEQHAVLHVERLINEDEYLFHAANPHRHYSENRLRQHGCPTITL